MKTKALAIFGLLLVPAYLLAQGAAKPGLVKSSGISASNVLPGTGTNTFTSNTTDANSSTTVAAFTWILANDIDGSDLHSVWRNSAATAVMRLTEAGALRTTDRITSENGYSGDSLVQFTDNGATGLLLLSATATNPTEAAITANTGRTITTNLWSWLNNSTAQARVTADGFYVQPVQTVTIADDATGAAPASAVTPTSNTVLLAYNDATAASVGTISETGAVAGKHLTIVHTGSGGTVVFTEVAGQQEIGGSACTLGLSDTLTVVYANSSWHKIACTDN